MTRLARAPLALCAIALLAAGCTHSASSHPAARPQTCTLHGVALDDAGGGAATGFDVGTIRVRDTTASPCLLHGPINVSGIDASGRTVTATVAYRVAPDLVLSPNAAPVAFGNVVPAGETVANILLIAEYRDDPTGPDARCVHQVVPQEWNVAMGAATERVRNASHDPENPTDQFTSLITCRGRFGTPSMVERDQ